MAFKYQLFSATCPQALMDITNKHLENLKPMTDDPEIILHIHYLQGLVTSASLITACSPFKNKIINEHFLSINLPIREEPIQMDQQETLLDLFDQLTPWTW